MTRALLLAPVLVGACYRLPSEAPCTVTCATTRECGGGQTCTNGLCTLANGSCGVVDALSPDAPLVDAPPGCFYGHAGGFFSSTLFCPGAAPLTLTVAFQSDFGSPQCQPVTGLDAYCVVMAHDVTVAQGSVNVTGARPLLVVADTIAIDGTLDVSTYRTATVTNGVGAGANDASCAIPVDGTRAVYGATGGAGGTFSAQGGAGGPVAGIAGAQPRPIVGVPNTLRGGCPGSNGGANTVASYGAAGSSGGAVYLLAHTLISFGPDGDVNAVGEGGVGSPPGGGGGGGGGSGGLIAFDTHMFMGAGFALANGGGGGGGASASAGGNAGGENANPTNAAAGGTGGTSGVDDGGPGSVGGKGGEGLGSSAGDLTELGGGGGGGGAGYILVFADMRPDATYFSPSPL